MEHLEEACWSSLPEMIQDSWGRKTCNEIVSEALSLVDGASQMVVPAKTLCVL